jgi:hypothetical protein
MATWAAIQQEVPELVARVRRVFDAYKHKTLATVRADGAPRISGTEVDFRDDDAWMGSMWQALKARDLQRDPRFAIHSATIDPDLVDGDAKIAGRAIEMDDDVKQAWIASYSEDVGQDPPEPMHLFRLDITEMVLTTIGDPADHLLIESWHEGRGYRRTERK